MPSSKWQDLEYEVLGLWLRDEDDDGRSDTHWVSYNEMMTQVGPGNACLAAKAFEKEQSDAREQATPQHLCPSCLRQRGAPTIPHALPLRLSKLLLRSMKPMPPATTATATKATTAAAAAVTAAMIHQCMRAAVMAAVNSAAVRMAAVLRA